MQQQALVQHALAERQRRALEQAVKLREAEARLDAQDRERAQARLALALQHALVPVTALVVGMCSRVCKWQLS